MPQKFQKDEYVVYSNAGVCHIKDIKSMKFPTEDMARTYYILQPIGNEASIFYIPVDKENLNGKLRKVLTKIEIDTILEGIKGKECDWENDKRKRTEDFKQILKNKNHQEMLLMASCIYLKKQELTARGKKLHSSDEEILKKAEHYIDEEFAFSLNLPTGQIGSYIQNKLGIET